MSCPLFAGLFSDTLLVRSSSAPPISIARLLATIWGVIQNHARLSETFHIEVWLIITKWTKKKIVSSLKG
ncbi:hypothetical protein PAENIP36_07990 [Paenibacillus sp. P36]